MLSRSVAIFFSFALASAMLVVVARTFPLNDGSLAMLATICIVELSAVAVP